MQRLLELGFHVDGWETTYAHILSGENPVLDWLRGTTLRPLLEKLDPPSQSEFLGELGGCLQQTYPPRETSRCFLFAACSLWQRDGRLWREEGG